MLSSMRSVKWCSRSAKTPSFRTTLYRALECKSRWGALPVLASNTVSGPQEADVRFSDAVVDEVFCNYGLCANKQCIEQRSDYS